MAWTPSEVSAYLTTRIGSVVQQNPRLHRCDAPPFASSGGRILVIGTFKHWQAPFSSGSTGRMT
jgi:hypothetical protein